MIYVVNPFKILLPYLNYQINYTYISSVLCENKNKPDTHCEGKCYLKKELKKAAEQETTEQVVVLQAAETEEIPSQLNTPGILHISLTEAEYIPLALQYYNSSIQGIITPPPQI